MKALLALSVLISLLTSSAESSPEQVALKLHISGLPETAAEEEETEKEGEKEEENKEAEKEEEKQDEDTVLIRITNIDTMKENDIPASEGDQTIMLDKGGSYYIRLYNLPGGTRADTQLTLFPPETEKDMEREIKILPLEVRIFQTAEGTDQFVEGGVIEIRNDQDGLIGEFVPSPDGRMIDQNGREIHLQDGKGYTISQKETAPGYEKGSEILFILADLHPSSNEPVKFYYPLKALPVQQEEPPAAAEPVIRYVDVPVEPAADPAPADAEKKAEIKTEKKKEAEKKETKEAESSGTMPSVYVSHIFPPVSASSKSEKKEAAETKKNTGFLVRMTDASHNYLSGASLAVYDSKGSPVDAWISGNEDHLIPNDKVKEGETYTIRLIRAAEGYSASAVDIEHVASACPDDRWPVIELSDKPKTEVKQTVSEQQKIRKTADWLVIGAAVAAGAAIILVIFTVVRHSAKSGS